MSPMPTDKSIQKLIAKVEACIACKAILPLPPKPLIQIHPGAKILLIGQAPGIKAHDSNMPWNDASGDRLREWLGVTEEEFYNPEIIANIPMAFCYPGKGKQGDLPPPPACARLWHQQLRDELPNIKLTILIGQYAHKAYLKTLRKKNLTATVRAWREYLPHFLPLPHPSPLNNIWLNKNKWFALEVLPLLSDKIHNILHI